ncbi:MAG: hypothetical protein LBR71_07760 [Synergistaceae bacterium]|jgi:hypothetical protein|nr:hypothetical protein [Synergistaceae bacterium]
MAQALPRLDNVRRQISQAREFIETRDFLTELLKMPENRLLPIFGIMQWSLRDVHALKDAVFANLVAALIQNGWNCNFACFGDSHRETFLMEMSSRGYSKTLSRLLDMGAEANYNSQGYGASTPLMCARDPEIMKTLLYFGANPLAVNALNQTDFTYKLLKGWVTGALFYLHNSEKIPFQSLMYNFKDCILSGGGNIPYEPMYPLCLVPVVPNGSSYGNIIDKGLIDSMLKEQFLPFTSAALTCPVEGLTAWQHIKIRMNDAKIAAPALALAFMACMAKLEDCRREEDFALFESYIEKEPPREFVPRNNFSKHIFVYMLFSLSSLPPTALLQWLVLIGKFTRKVAFWMDLFGETAFRVVNPSLPDRGGSHVLQELLSMQALLSMRVNVTPDYGEFGAPANAGSMPEKN